MNTKKIFFTDLDNTLLDSRKEISQGNRDAIAKALKQGHHIVLATGRPVISIISIINDLDLQHEGCFAITYNGGLIYDCFKKEAVYKKSLPLSYVTHIFEKAKEFGLPCQTYDSKRLIGPADSPELRTYAAHSKIPYYVDPHCPYDLTEEPVKVLITGDENRLKTEAYLKSMTNWAKGKIDMFYSSATYLEHVPLGISKGFAVRFLCDLLNIPIENSVAAGDAENDIPMIQVAHIGAAMYNGAENVKDAADYITANDCDHSGVAEIINKFVLNEVS